MPLRRSVARRRYRFSSVLLQVVAFRLHMWDLSSHRVWNKISKCEILPARSVVSNGPIGKPKLCIILSTWCGSAPVIGYELGIRKGGRSKRCRTFFDKEISFSAIASGHSIAHKARTVFHNHANLAKILHQKELGFDFLVKEYLRHGVHGCDCGGRSLGGGNDLNKFHQVCRREKVCAYNILLPFCNWGNLLRWSVVRGRESEGVNPFYHQKQFIPHQRSKQMCWMKELRLACKPHPVVWILAFLFPCPQKRPL